MEVEEGHSGWLQPTLECFRPEVDLVEWRPLSNPNSRVVAHKETRGESLASPFPEPSFFFSKKKFFKKFYIRAVVWLGIDRRIQEIMSRKYSRAQIW